MHKCVSTCVRAFNVGLQAVAVTAFDGSSTLTNVLLSNGSVGHFGIDTSMYEPVNNSSMNSTNASTSSTNVVKNNADTVQLYNLTVAGGRKVIAINGPLAMLDSGSIVVLPSYVNHFNYTTNEVDADTTPYIYSKIGTGYMCPAILTVSASESDGLANAIMKLKSQSQYRYIQLEAGTHHVTSTLVVTSNADIIIKGGPGVVIDCRNVQPCFLFTDCYNVTVQDLSIQGSASSRRRVAVDTRDSSGDKQHRELATNSKGLIFENVPAISISNVTLQGFNSNNGSALHIKCSNAQSCSNVDVTRVHFVHNTAAQYGGAVMLDISVTGTQFNFNDVTFDGNTAQAGAAIYW
eukprot:6372-Heterococcus_DN1.PRE.2